MWGFFIQISLNSFAIIKLWTTVDVSELKFLNICTRSHGAQYLCACFCPKGFSHQYVNAYKGASITILMFRSYRFTHQLICLHCHIEMNHPLTLLLHDWRLQLVLSHREVFSNATHGKTWSCHSANHEQNGSHCPFCSLHFAGLVECAVH